MTRSRLFRSAAAMALGSLCAGAGTSAAAQAVVQPLPPRAQQDLAEALGRLARNAEDAEALLDAGEAALALGDLDGAIGFFGRAKQKAPTNARAALGLARAHTAARRPVEALRFFAEAERGGAPAQSMAAERGLAYDLVGDAASAQALYRLALAQGANPQVTRQLALSQAIAGDRKAFEATLLPLLEKKDTAAFRTRAFGLAILGNTKDAIKIARDMMPGPVASRIEPYLRYMTKLTPAQQAAAGNLGIFPSSGNMGRDTPAIAQARAAPPSIAASPAPATAAKVQPRPVPPVRSVAAAPAPRGQSAPSLRGADRPLAPTGAPMGAPAPAPSAVTRPAAAVPAPVRIASAPRVAPAQTAAEDTSVAEAFAAFGQLPATTAKPAVGAVDITRIDVPREKKPAPPPPAAKPAPPAPAAKRVPPPPPPPPKVPSRIWVQVATGKDRAALKFDWRRIARKADAVIGAKGPFVTRWGEANRLLAGPYPSGGAARDAVKKLKDMGLDAFTFTSAAGEAIDPLK